MEHGLGSTTMILNPKGMQVSVTTVTRLVALLRETGEPAVELYGVWDGDFDFTTPPAIREEISVENLLERGFRFKEGGFYVVTLKLLAR
jgi:hypothetical protein